MDDVRFKFSKGGRKFEVSNCSTTVLGGSIAYISVRAFYSDKEEQANNVNQLELKKGKNPLSKYITKEQLKEFDFLDNFKKVIDESFDSWYIEFLPKTAKTRPEDIIRPSFGEVVEGFGRKVLALVASYEALNK